MAVLFKQHIYSLRLISFPLPVSGLPVLRPDTVEMSVWGVASLAGLEAGVWTSVEEVVRMRGRGQEFTRSETGAGTRHQEFRRWLEACRRFCNWKAAEIL